MRPHTPYVSEPGDNRIWKHLLPSILHWNLSVGTTLLLSAAFPVYAFQLCWVVNNSRTSFMHARRLGKTFLWLHYSCSEQTLIYTLHFCELLLFNTANSAAHGNLICPSYIKKASQDDNDSSLHPKAVKVTAYSVLLKSVLVMYRSDHNSRLKINLRSILHFSLHFLHFFEL